jgi:hypothetical protein
MVDAEGHIARLGQGLCGRVHPGAVPGHPAAAKDQQHRRAWRVTIGRSEDIQEQGLAIGLTVRDITLNPYGSRIWRGLCASPRCRRGGAEAGDQEESEQQTDTGWYCRTHT